MALPIGFFVSIATSLVGSALSRGESGKPDISAQNNFQDQLTKNFKDIEVSAIPFENSNEKANEISSDFLKYDRSHVVDLYTALEDSEKRNLDTIYKVKSDLTSQMNQVNENLKTINENLKISTNATLTYGASNLEATAQIQGKSGGIVDSVVGGVKSLLTPIGVAVGAAGYAVYSGVKSLVNLYTGDNISVLNSNRMSEETQALKEQFKAEKAESQKRQQELESQIASLNEEVKTVGDGFSSTTGIETPEEMQKFIDLVKQKSQDENLREKTPAFTLMTGIFNALNDEDRFIDLFYGNKESGISNFTKKQGFDWVKGDTIGNFENALRAIYKDFNFRTETSAPGITAVREHFFRTFMDNVSDPNLSVMESLGLIEDYAKGITYNYSDAEQRIENLEEEVRKEKESQKESDRDVELVEEFSKYQNSIDLNNKLEDIGLDTTSKFENPPPEGYENILDSLGSFESFIKDYNRYVELDKAGLKLSDLTDYRDRRIYEIFSESNAKEFIDELIEKSGDLASFIKSNYSEEELKKAGLIDENGNYVSNLGFLASALNSASFSGVGQYTLTNPAEAILSKLYSGEAFAYDSEGKLVTDLGQMLQVAQEIKDQGYSDEYSFSGLREDAGFMETYSGLAPYIFDQSKLESVSSSDRDLVGELDLILSNRFADANLSTQDLKDLQYAYTESIIHSIGDVYGAIQELKNRNDSEGTVYIPQSSD